MKTTNISYIKSNLQNVQVIQKAASKINHQQRKKTTLLEINGESYEATDRFWNSLFSRFSISNSVFRYFDHAEVFKRISLRLDEKAKLRFCVENNGKDKKILAISTPGTPGAVIEHDGIMRLLQKQGGDQIEYNHGMLKARFRPASGLACYKIGGDDFRNSLQLEVPIDGYGKPKIYLELIRQICSNGAVGIGEAFRSEINIGNDPYYSIAHTLDSYDNDQGFAAFQSKFESSQKSWASMQEAYALQQVLVTSKVGRDHLKDFHKLTGDLPVIYGLSNIGAIPLKRQSVLPTKAKVYDLINFATELATHKAPVEEKGRLQGFVGTLISTPFDLENSSDKVVDFKDFFTDAKAKIKA